MTKYRMVVLKSGLLWQSYDIFATDDATAKDLAQQRFDELSRARVGGEAGHAEGPAGVVNGEAPGNTPLLTAAHRQALLQIVESGPIPAVHGVVRWRLIAPWRNGSSRNFAFRSELCPSTRLPDRRHADSASEVRDPSMAISFRTTSGDPKFPPEMPASRCLGDCHSLSVAFPSQRDISFQWERGLSMLEIIHGLARWFANATRIVSGSFFLSANKQRIVTWRTRLRIVILC
jgi:hypothetical protein